MSDRTKAEWNQALGDEYQFWGELAEGAEARGDMAQAIELRLSQIYWTTEDLEIKNAARRGIWAATRAGLPKDPRGNPVETPYDRLLDVIWGSPDEWPPRV
jgi:hypothetical protein